MQGSDRSTSGGDRRPAAQSDPAGQQAGRRPLASQPHTTQSGGASSSRASQSNTTSHYNAGFSSGANRAQDEAERTPQQDWRRNHAAMRSTYKAIRIEEFVVSVRGLSLLPLKPSRQTVRQQHKEFFRANRSGPESPLQLSNDIVCVKAEKQWASLQSHGNSF